MLRTRIINRPLSGHALTTLLLISAWLMLPSATLASNVLIETPLGNIELELLENDAPKTVANFLNYLNTGRYEKAFIHRSVPGFIIQGGGFTFDTDVATGIPTFPTVENEFGVSNTRGTVAMAKLGDDPNSATSQWFINLADNSGSLDSQNGGFTVFARVVSGMEIADAISELTTWDARSVFGGAFSDLPLIDFVKNGSVISEENIVFTASAEANSFVMNAGLNDAWFNPATNGQGFFVTVFPDIQKVFLSWFTFDTELPADDASANLGDPGHRWITAFGSIQGNRSEMTISITSGGLFDTSTETQGVTDGTIILTFDDCATGLVEYDIPSIDKQGSVPIERIALDNQALCEALAEPVEN